MKREINWTQTPLIPGIVQDDISKMVLMMGYLNKDSLEETLRTGFVTFYSRSRKKLWQKGETSGNTLRVKEILIDCDSDTILLKVTPNGSTCHTLTPSCFQASELEVLEDVVESRTKENSNDSYTSRLVNGERKNLYKKIGEEASEVVVALAIQEKSDVVDEIADLVFHLTVAMNVRKIKWRDVFKTLAERRQSSKNKSKDVII